MRNNLKRAAALLVAMLVAGSTLYNGTMKVYAEGENGEVTPPEETQEVLTVQSVEPVADEHEAQFYVVINTNSETVSEEINSADGITQNYDIDYLPVFKFEYSENVTEEDRTNIEKFIVENNIYTEEDFYKLINDGNSIVVATDGFSFADEEFMSKAEAFGEAYEYAKDENGNDIIETDVEELFNDDEVLEGMFAFVQELADASGDTVTKNIIVVTGKEIDWYVVKDTQNKEEDPEAEAWHVDGNILSGTVMIHKDNTIKDESLDGDLSEDSDNISGTVSNMISNNLTLQESGLNLPGKYAADTQNVKYYTMDENGNKTYVDAINAAGTYYAEVSVVYSTDSTATGLTFSSLPYTVTYTVTVARGTAPVNPTPVTPTPGPSDEPTPTPEAEPIVITVEAPVVVPPVNQTPVTPVPVEVVEAEEVIIEEEPVALVDEVPTEEVKEPEVVAIEEESTPLAETVDIEDEETPLATAGHCWIHWVILAMTLLYLVFVSMRAYVNSKELKEAKTVEAK